MCNIIVTLKSFYELERLNVLSQATSVEENINILINDEAKIKF